MATTEISTSSRLSVSRNFPVDATALRTYQTISESDRTKLHVNLVGVSPSGTVDSQSFGLTLYAFDSSSPGNSPFTAKLDLEAARRLCSFLNSISLVRDHNRSSSGPFIEVAADVSPAMREALSRDPDFVKAVWTVDPSVLLEFVQNDLDTVDIKSLAYRKAQLSAMSRLLDDEDYFNEQERAVGGRGPEAVWQHFFDQNQWIFGYGLSYIVGEGVDSSRLEQVVAGHSIGGVGKRVDALLRTRGILRSLCFVEIKHHRTSLLSPDQYRSGAWQPSLELTGAVAQVQRSVQRAVETLGFRASIRNKDGWDVASYFNYAPRAIVVCGSLEQFINGARENEPMFSSFELYRRNTLSPEILTFDELRERASSIVRSGEERSASQL